MELLKASELWPLPVYESLRDDYRKSVIAAKKDRRIAVGPFMTLVFENRTTVKFQVQEIAYDPWNATQLITDLEQVL